MSNNETDQFCWITCSEDETERVQIKMVCIAKKDGLAVAELPGGMYSITHVATGKKIGPELPRNKALAIFERMLPLADWHPDTAVLVKASALKAIVKRGRIVGWK